MVEVCLRLSEAVSASEETSFKFVVSADVADECLSFYILDFGSVIRVFFINLLVLKKGGKNLKLISN